MSVYGVSPEPLPILQMCSGGGGGGGCRAGGGLCIPLPPFFSQDISNLPPAKVQQPQILQQEDPQVRTLLVPEDSRPWEEPSADPDHRCQGTALTPTPPPPPQRWGPGCRIRPQDPASSGLPGGCAHPGKKLLGREGGAPFAHPPPPSPDPSGMHRPRRWLVPEGGRAGGEKVLPSPGLGRNDIIARLRANGRAACFSEISPVPIKVGGGGRSGKMLRGVSVSVQPDGLGGGLLCRPRLDSPPHTPSPPKNRGPPTRTPRPPVKQPCPHPPPAGERRRDGDPGHPAGWRGGHRSLPRPESQKGC